MQINKKIIFLMIVCTSLFGLFLQTSKIAAQQAITVEDLWNMKRIGNVVISPDGKWIAFTLTTYEMETNKSNTDIYVVSTDDGSVKPVVENPGYDGAPAWRSDSKALAFVSSRDGSAQIYLKELNGGEAEKISSVPTGIDNFAWSGDNQYFLISTSLYPDAKDLQQSAKRDEEKADAKVQAKIIEHLMFRHWNQWRNGKRSHVFLLSNNGNIIRDCTPGDMDTPPIDLGSSHDFTFSPDNQQIAFVRNEDPVVALSTNNDIFTTPLNENKITKLTENKANDNQPVYSPDGQYIAYHAMARAGFEADQYDLILYNRTSGTRENLTEGFDLDVDEIVWAPNGNTIYFNSENQGRVSIFSIDIKKGTIKQLVYDHINTNLNISPNGKTLYFRRQAANMPYEIFAFDIDKEEDRQLTYVNKALLSQLKMNPVEDFWFESFDGHKVHGLMVKPPFFEEGKKYPLVYLIHGGPQGMWSDDFHYRWNSEMFAAPGYVVAMVNFRGSKGYGQWFCDQVSKNWGGGPYQDLMAGLKYVLDHYSFIDSSKIAAAGASYGGFMIDWIAGQANTSPANKFKCFVTHDGVFDQISMYGATEELWFPEWEFGGNPYQHPQLYDKWSPSRYAKNFSIPTLVIHSQQDFRVPVTQGFQMFTALQRMGVPSKLLYFPDEYHFVTKPLNARLWWNTVLGWIDEWINK